MIDNEKKLPDVMAITTNWDMHYLFCKAAKTHTRGNFFLGALIGFVEPNSTLP